ncbi:hypothetical protein V6N13_141484 [Hibiscus sabdariffa]
MCVTELEFGLLKKNKGRLEDEFNKLFDYVFALREADPTGGFKGEILAVVGRDGNNQIFPIAWAVVEVENRETWAWFLEHIQTDLEIGDGDRFNILSDMQKGLLEEIQIILPNVEHIFCARHMYANWKKEHTGHDMQQVFWACCKATTEAEFHKHSAKMATMNDTALSSLLKRDPKHWSKAFFATHSKCDAVDNNFGEAFNSTIISARYKSIIYLFGDIRHYVMNRNLAHKDKCQKCEGFLCPKIVKLVENHKASSAYCHVTWNGQNGFEVYCNGSTYVVDLQGHKCTCRYWDLTSIPCSHSICVILFNCEPIERYVHEAYTKETYQSLYDCALPTIPSEAFWKDTKMGLLEPPVKRKLPRRLKQKRKREEGETTKGCKLSKQGSKCTGRCCGVLGHNTRTCLSKNKAVLNKHESTSSQPTTINPSQPAATNPSKPPATNPSQPVTNHPSQPPAPNPSQPASSYHSQPSCGRQ